MTTNTYKSKRFKALDSPATVPQCTRLGHLNKDCPYFTKPFEEPDINPYADLPNPEDLIV